MENFTWNIPTHMHFGKDVCLGMRDILPGFGTKALLLRGGESTLRNGIRAKIVLEIEAAGMQWKEFSGIKPNPRIAEVRDATYLGRTFRPDVIIAVGGGSVIDSAKAVAASIPVNNDPWDLYTGALKPEAAVPIVAVLTLAATGTEMNPFSVCQNPESGLKAAFGSKLVAPKHSFLDPSFTISVPRDQTGYGISDLVAHCMEAWFGVGDASLSDRFTAAIIQEAIEFGPRLLKEVDNYELRAKIMYAATCALNEITMFGRKSGDWGVHSLGHTFSLLYDTPHGATLSAVFPAWLELQRNRIPQRIEQFGKAVFGVDGIDETIEKTRAMFRSFLSPVSISEMNIVNYNEENVIKAMIHSRASGYFHKLNADDYRQILKMMQ